MRILIAFYAIILYSLLEVTYSEKYHNNTKSFPINSEVVKHCLGNINLCIDETSIQHDCNLSNLSSAAGEGKTMKDLPVY